MVLYSPFGTNLSLYVLIIVSGYLLTYTQRALLSMLYRTSIISITDLFTILQSQQICFRINYVLDSFKKICFERYAGTNSHQCWRASKHVTRGIDTSNFCPILQVLDISILSDAADVHPVIKFLPHMLQHLAVNSRDCLHNPLSQLW